MNITSEETYTNFLECIISSTDLEDLYHNSLEYLKRIFNVDRVQIWERTTSANEMSVLHEYKKDEKDSSMLKFRIEALSPDFKKVIQSQNLWEYLNISDKTLNKFNINSLTGINIDLPEKPECLLILTSKENNKKSNTNEINILIKIKSRLEQEIKKLSQFETSKNEASRLQAHNSKLREHDRLRTNFINNISHEFRTPLASIVGFSKMLTSKNGLSESVKEIAEQIHHAANRLSLLITDFLETNKSSTESWVPNIQSCDVGEIIKDAAEEFHSLNKEHKILYNISDNYPIINTDPKLVRQVLDNLIINAIKYSPKDTKVTVSLEILQDKKLLRVSVTDEGTGINKNEISKIFNRFYRASNSNTQRVTGSGLGLSISKEIVTILNGTIEAESEPNKGSKFSFTLPL